MRVRARSTSLSIAAACATLAAGCTGREPAVTDVQWSVQRATDGKSYNVAGTATLSRGNDGWYQPTVRVIDDRGRSTATELQRVLDPGRGSQDARATPLAGIVKVARPVATAELTITFATAPGIDPATIKQTLIYSNIIVVDPKIVPPGDPENPCSDAPPPPRKRTRTELRERASTDPDGADAEAISNMGRNELMATAINSAGYLCARVTSMYPSGGAIIADCVEYRSGRGRVRYRVDPQAGRVDPL